jgi:hypothetical protein
MNRMFAIALLAVAGYIGGGHAVAQEPQAHYQTIQFGPGYLQIGSCNVNGQVCPVGQDFRVSGYANGNAWVIGWVNQIQGNAWMFHGAQGGVFQVYGA